LESDFSYKAHEQTCPCAFLYILLPSKAGKKFSREEGTIGQTNETESMSNKAAEDHNASA
jgi:hypothetical protein